MGEMTKRPDFSVGDIIRLGKPHPCGGYEWEILRVGMDFRLKCLNCERQVQLKRSDVEKRCKKIVHAADNIGKDKLSQ